MNATTFLSNELLWQQLPARIKAARHVDAAIAYFGQGGAKLFPLRKGDRLVVDMSLSTVRAGATDPREVEKLVCRGAQAFTRRNLHAKLIVADGSVLCGSANISKRSQQVLDEAAIITRDLSVVRRAREFIHRLCTEPVRSDYLERCKRAYKPPHFAGGAIQRGGQQRVEHAKLWMVNLRENLIPESEVERYEKSETKAAKLAKDPVRCRTDSFHWPYKPKMASELEMGDWIVQVMTYRDKRVFVYPPAQFLFSDHYLRDYRSGKERWVFRFEIPRSGQRMRWTQFRRAVNSSAGMGSLRMPRTMPVRDVQVADQILGLWTPGGRISRR